MTVLYIARHGDTFEKGETVLRVGARTDLPLSASGKAQAEKLGQHFAGGAFAKIFTAPLKRTCETAAIIAAGQASPAPVIALDALTEIDYGPDEGRPEADVIARLGADALKAWEEQAVPPAGWRVDPAALCDSWRSLFEQLASKDKDAAFLAVTSNGVARFALQAAGGEPDRFPLKLRTGAYGVIRIDPNAATNIENWDVRP